MNRHIDSQIPARRWEKDESQQDNDILEMLEDPGLNVETNENTERKNLSAYEVLWLDEEFQTFEEE